MRLRLKTATDVRRTLSKIANMVANGEMDTKQANTIILACNATLSAIKTEEQGKRIDELEDLINEQMD